MKRLVVISMLVLFVGLGKVGNSYGESVGCIQGDCVNGKGIARYSDGTVYEGDWKDRKKHGKGFVKFKLPDGFFVYKGDFRNDLMHGQGVASLPDGRVYTGDFENNMMQGKGVYNLPDGSVYEGDIDNNMIQGKGVLTLPDGRVIKGNFINGVYSGK